MGCVPAKHRYSDENWEDETGDAWSLRIAEKSAAGFTERDQWAELKAYIDDVSSGQDRKVRRSSSF